MSRFMSRIPAAQKIRGPSVFVPGMADMPPSYALGQMKQHAELANKESKAICRTYHPGTHQTEFWLEALREEPEPMF